MEQGVLDLQPGLEGLVAFCELIGEPLEPYQRRIARAYFGEAREIAILLPRGNAKTTLAALIGTHHLLTTDAAAATIGAASVQQARICLERIKGFAAHPAIEGLLTIRALEVRYPEAGGMLRMVPADGARAHGLSSTLYVADEVWSWKGPELLEAMQTGLVKRKDCKLLAISTAAANLDSPLGRLRARAMAQPTAKRTGPVVESTGPLHWLEWSVDDEVELDDFEAAKAANPASWIEVEDLQRQRAAVPDLAYGQFHCNRWGRHEGSWLPAGAWQACVGDPCFTDGEDLWLGIDVGGERSASAVVWVNAELHVGAAIYHGDAGVLECVEQVRELAAQYNVREVVFDPWRFGQAAQELERERVPVLQFPQTDVRMVPASIRLHAAITEGRLTLPDDPLLASHAAHTIAKHSRRGWRIDKASPRDNMDAIVALCMALERAEHREAPVEMLGWL